MTVNIGNHYKLLAPRPTVCVSTLSSDGTSNLAPFSFATPLSFDPPLLGVSVGHGKDTLLNARETEDFVVAPLTSRWKEKGVRAEISLGRDESEFEEIGLTENPSKEVDSPSIKEAPINIECEYWDDFKAGDHSLLVGKVVSISAEEEAIKNGRINLEGMGAIGHVTGEEFCLSDVTIKIERE
ncbi:hypothetical protein AKJ44_02765 [candidate division MSBL1 archaeon SCGC-AAA261F17]|uniref:Flavin reductase like domain-containing protein n=1 Tax=candidate division MSBL1 archaeon SCGC-AAA261F17 TaxID=1698274 RepID=A0A133V462_9EURY|nr:hypothetical protein AKJ44_02765 [candidate division MSBL1 archaeon SCGC-AAA261F17]